MGYLKNFLTGKTSRKIKATQSKIRDVKALHKFKRSGGNAGLGTIERQGAVRAANRLGDDMSMFSVRSTTKGRKK